MPAGTLRAEWFVQLAQAWGAELRSTIGGRQSAGRVCNVQNEVKWLIKEDTLNIWQKIRREFHGTGELVLTCRFTIQVSVSAKQKYLLLVPDFGWSQTQILFQDEMYVESWGCSIEFLTTVHMMIAVRWRSNFCYRNRNPKKINKINNKFAEYKWHQQNVRKTTKSSCCCHCIRCCVFMSSRKQFTFFF